MPRPWELLVDLLLVWRSSSDSPHKEKAWCTSSVACVMGRNLPSSSAEARTRAGLGERGGGARCGRIAFRLEIEGSCATGGLRGTSAMNRRRGRARRGLRCRWSLEGKGGFGRTDEAILVPRRCVVMRTREEQGACLSPASRVAFLDFVPYYTGRFVLKINMKTVITFSHRRI